MTTYEFTCPECRRVFTVTDSMRDAILTNGCPVCGCPATGSHFDAPTPTA